MKTKRPLAAILVLCLFFLFLSIATSSVLAGQTAQTCGDDATNPIVNHSFESGLDSWKFYSNGKASYKTVTAAYHCSQSVSVEITQPGTNVQLYQSDLSLQANSDYILRFAAKSNTGHDVRVVLQKHSPDYTNYGLSQKVNLTTSWQQFELPFTTSGFSGTVNNGRLRFWLAPYDAAGDRYWFDQVEIVSASGSIDPDPTVTPDPGDGGGGGSCTTVANNAIVNPGFEAGTGDWKFYTNGNGSFAANTNVVFQCNKAAQINITQAGSNVQLYQNDISLQPDTRYRLTFSAKSNSAHDLSVTLQKHQSPYTNYGLRDATANLTTSWKTFEYEFTTRGFSNNINNGRLRFWLAPYDAAGDKYYIDDVQLVPLGGSTNPDPDPTTPPPNPTSPPPSGGKEMVIYTWNGNVTEANRGFPWHQPPMENGDWTSPVNYAEGTLYMRAKIVSQPVAQKDMRLQFCFWQEKNGNRFALETCMSTQNVPGTAGTVRCWSQDIDKMWKKGGKPIEWNRPRYRVAVPIKNGAGLPVSDFNGWNWNGENPKEWYPLNMKVTVVVVAKGATFSGWQNYGGGC